MPTQEAKAHHVGEWASLRNTSPEIAEAIFEVAGYDEKMAEKIWEEGSDEVLVKAFAKTDKDSLFGANRPSNVKTFNQRLPRFTRGGFQIVDKVRFVHAGCGVNALSGLHDRANSI
ncbi:putative cytoplasmic protein YccJ [Escherichia coli]|nr:putative cytoplasmic protein YccJ [Escherichia coli]